MRFTTEEAVVKHGTHERRKTAALSAKGELEEPFSAPTFGRTATAPMHKLRSPLDFTSDRTSAARIWHAQFWMCGMRTFAPVPCQISD